ncbi:shugoshin [Drosophila subpulchrella]|uniref:shugoshin n=1 Tax=Drosophila subpulchrella TaxID=1486046 RepID=UPI0018A16234|nr:shugoshin [Drosophila subpulchrella]
MAGKVEMQYKLLNSELMEQVQKQRLEIGEYRKRVISLERENMDLREEYILEKDRQRLENIGIVRSLMQRLNVNTECLESGVTQEPAPVVSRPTGPRRSSREICKDIRRTCALARTTRTISPRRSITSISTIRSSYRSSAEVVPEVEATEVTEKRRVMNTPPPPRRPAELLFDEDESDEESEITSAEQNQEPQTDQNQENKLLFSIIEENDSETETTDSSSSCEAIYCDTTIESSPTNVQTTAPPCGRALREVDTNVPEAVALRREKEPVKSRLAVHGTEENYAQVSAAQLTRRTLPDSEEDSLHEPVIQRSKRAPARLKQSSVRDAEGNSLQEPSTHQTRRATKLKISSVPNVEGNSVHEPSILRSRRSATRLKHSSVHPAEEDSAMEPSIQYARLAVNRPSYSSGIFPDVNGNTPRRSMFNGIGQVAGSTSTPIAARHRTTAHKKSDQMDISSSCFSSSGRPSRSCRPTSLVEPSLRKKLRNESKGEAKK